MIDKKGKLFELKEPNAGAKNKYYMVTAWKGQPNYECLHCPFATLSIDEMTQHIGIHVREGSLKPKAAEKTAAGFTKDKAADKKE